MEKAVYTMVIKLLKACSSILVLVPAIVMAESDTKPVSESMGAALARAAFALIVVIALIFLVVYLLKRFIPGLALKASIRGCDENRIEMLDTKSVAPKRSIHLVRVGNREVLIGSSEQGMALLGQWEVEDYSRSDSECPDEAPK